VDPDTGTVSIVNFTAVDDFGKIINPMIVEGQVHGGLTQGIGQALTEGCHYDKESGQLVTGSYLDYCMPRADDVPAFKVGTKETPCTHNPSGEGLRRGGRDRRSGRGDERAHRRAGSSRHRDAGDAAENLRACQESKMKKAA